MSQPGGEPRDPFRTDGRPPATTPPTQPPPPPSGQDGDQTSTDPQARRTAIRLAVVSVAAVASAFFAPPVGVVLGVVAIVVAVRSREVVPSRPRVLAIVSGSIALVVGVTITGAALFFREEITEYSRCLQAANTVQAQQNCQDALNESLSSRLGL